MTTITTIGGWTVVLLGALTFYFVSGQRKTKNLRHIVPKSSVKTEPRKEAPKSKKARKDGGQSSGDQAAKSKAPKKKAQPVKKAERDDQAFTSAADVEAPAEQKNKHDMSDDREFARQLHNKKTGTVAAPKSQTASRPKSVKQTHAQEKPVDSNSDNPTAPSSTTGGDADDDESPLNSPALGATEVAKAVNGDVSDMLEKPAPGPSVLKINAPTKPVQAKKTKTEAPATPTEGKQQKKNKKKAQQAKALKEEAEAERKEKLEKQLKTARVAEGRAAKDGSTFLAAQSPSSSAWTAPAANANCGNTATAGPKVELLDTYESTSSTPVTKQPAKVFASNETHGSGLLTDDEAVARVMEETADWEIVKTKERKTRPKKETQEAKENVNLASEKQGKQAPYGTPELIAPTGPGQEWDVEHTYVSGGETTGGKYVPKGGVVNEKKVITDSEWVVS